MILFSLSTKSSHKMSYIAVAIQDGNFTSRLGLIPHSEFMAARSEDWELINKHRTTELIEGIQVPNVVWQDFNWEGNVGDMVEHPHTQMVELLRDVIERGEIVTDEHDHAWASKIRYPMLESFDVASDFMKLCSITSVDGEPISIADSLCCLERRNGKFYPPSFRTIEELSDFYQSNKEN
jgi:hypothetical protein